MLFLCVDLTSLEMPATASGRLEVMIREKMADTTEGQEETSSGQQLMCGEFTNLGSPPVSVVWEVSHDWSECGQFKHKLCISSHQHCVGERLRWVRVWTVHA